MYAGVYLLDAPYAIDRLYDYKIPPSLSGSVRRGSLAAVPFGGGNRRSYALVTEVRDTTSAVRTKSLLTVLPERYCLSEEMTALALFLKEHTLCTVGDAVHTLIPPGIFSGIRETFFPVPGASVPPSAADFYRVLSEKEKWDADALLSRFGKDGEKAARKGVENGYVAVTAEPAPPHNLLKKKLYRLRDPDASRALLESGGTGVLRSAGQKALLRAALVCGEADADTLCDTADVSAATLAGLLAKGLFSVREVECMRNPYLTLSEKRDTSEICLSRAQGAAYETLSSLCMRDEPTAALLFGVTGSGKTKVILKLIDDVIRQKKTAIVLVPEIALTPQTVGIFCARYGERVAVLHSSLGAGERFDAWRRIRDGAVDLVIGTRSAVFAPLTRLGLIVIDEEHEHTYKSDQNPKYHARDVAAFRCGRHNAALVLASATPSIESYYKAEKGVYTLVRLTERYGGAALPATEIVDMREELRNGNRSPVGERLREALIEAKAADKQAILFLNRRGYNSAVTCLGCGEAISCPHCSVSLTYHADGGGYLLCHMCGYKQFPPRVCPACGSTHLSYIGCGTEKAESELRMLFPDSRVLRMDADTTGTKQAYENILSRFRRGEGDILLGTQMVTKGHDFPRVTVAGVLLADSSLRVNDFRASERTFSLLTQVLGRAGRADTAGRAIIQTYSPENPVIRLAAKQDYEAFYRGEIALRKSLLFPPFCDMAELTLTGSDENALLRAAVQLAGKVKETAARYADMPLQAFGPFQAQTYKVGGKFRMRMILKCRLTKVTRAFLSELLQVYGKDGKGPLLSVDCNPSYV